MFLYERLAGIPGGGDFLTEGVIAEPERVKRDGVQFGNIDLSVFIEGALFDLSFHDLTDDGKGVLGVDAYIVCRNNICSVRDTDGERFGLEDVLRALMRFADEQRDLIAPGVDAPRRVHSVGFPIFVIGGNDANGHWGHECSSTNLFLIITGSFLFDSVIQRQPILDKPIITHSPGPGMTHKLKFLNI